MDNTLALVAFIAAHHHDAIILPNGNIAATTDVKHPNGEWHKETTELPPRASAVRAWLGY